MHLRKVAKVILLVVVLAGLFAGCGSGDQSGNESGKQSNNGAQHGGAPGGKEEGGKEEGGNAVKKKAPKIKTALGTIKRLNPDKRRIVLRPHSEIQGGERMFFKVPKKTKISLDDKEAELADAKRGRQARIEYVVVKMKEKERNRARVVDVFSAD